MVTSMVTTYYSFLFISISVIIILIFIVNYTKLTIDTFTNYPQQIDPTKLTSSTQGSQLDELNINYRLMLQYIQQNPDRSIPFIKDVQSKFCSSDNIKFNSLLDNYSPVFK